MLGVVIRRVMQSSSPFMETTGLDLEEWIKSDDFWLGEGRDQLKSVGVIQERAVENLNCSKGCETGTQI